MRDQMSCNSAPSVHLTLCVPLVVGTKTQCQHHLAQLGIWTKQVIDPCTLLGLASIHNLIYFPLCPARLSHCILSCLRHRPHKNVQFLHGQWSSVGIK